MGDNGAATFEPFGISGQDEMLWRKSVLLTQLVAASAGIAKKAGEVIRSKAGQDLKVIQKVSSYIDSRPVQYEGGEGVGGHSAGKKTGPRVG